MKQLTSEEFETKLNNGEKFIVDFFAHWCSPCKMMMPIVEKFDEFLISNNSEIAIYKFDVDTDKSIPSRLGIRGVPTIKAFSNGKETFSKSGVMMENELKNLANNLLHG